MIGNLLNSDNIWLLIPLAALLFGMIKALSRHQVQMAEIVHRSELKQATNEDVASLRAELKTLHEKLDALTISMDNLGRASSTRSRLEERLEDVAR